jgi:hypothetical protein
MNDKETQEQPIKGMEGAKASSMRLLKCRKPASAGFSARYSPVIPGRVWGGKGLMQEV